MEMQQQQNDTRFVDCMTLLCDLQTPLSCKSHVADVTFHLSHASTSLTYFSMCLKHEVEYGVYHSVSLYNALLMSLFGSRRVIYGDGARVLGVLAKSRAIGDNYLKPYVISKLDVTVTDCAAEDECLILASDDLWDLVSNEIACDVVRMCLLAQKATVSQSASSCRDATARSDKACFDASILLTKLSLARHSNDNINVVVVDLRRPRRLWSSCTPVQWF